MQVSHDQTNRRRTHIAAVPLDEQRVIVFHSLLGQPRLIEFDTPDEATIFMSSINTDVIATGDDELDAFINYTDNEARAIARTNGTAYLTARRPINYLSLLTSEACNLGCPYCIAGANMKTAALSKAATMHWATARDAVDWYFHTITADTYGYLNFTGGEPLLNWPVVHETLDYVSQHYRERFPRLAISINTNATLITDQVANILKKYNVIVATSLDGAPAASDLVRISKATQLGVSDKILRGWQRLASAGHPITGFMATFNDRNITALNETLIDFAAEQGCTWLRVDCDVIHLLQYPVEELVERIWNVYKYGKQRGIQVEGFWSTAMHNLVADATTSPVTFFCGAVSGETASIHPDGRISACGFSRNSIGHVTKPHYVDWDTQQAFIESYTPGNRAFCKGCMIEGPCAGGCNIAREEAASSHSEAAIEFNCSLYRSLTPRLLRDYFLDSQRANCSIPELSTLRF